MFCSDNGWDNSIVILCIVSRSNNSICVFHIFVAIWEGNIMAFSIDTGFDSSIVMFYSETFRVNSILMFCIDYGWNNYILIYCIVTIWESIIVAFWFDIGEDSSIAMFFRNTS